MSLNFGEFPNGGDAALHFQHFERITADIGRYGDDLRKLQESMREVRAVLESPASARHMSTLIF